MEEEMMTMQPEPTLPPADAPEQTSAAPNPAEQALAALQAEHDRMLLLEQTRAALSGRGLDPGFADFLAGEDWERTKERIALFETQYSEAVRDAVSSRLPEQEPKDFSAEKRKSRRRGVFRVE